VSHPKATSFGHSQLQSVGHQTDAPNEISKLYSVFTTDAQQVRRGGVFTDASSRSSKLASGDATEAGRRTESR
jgi:hypothetical protein